VATIHQWHRADKRSGDAQVARGVLFECIASPAGIANVSLVRLPEDERDACQLVLPNPQPGQMFAQNLSPFVNRGCRRAAQHAYEAALDRNPDLTEAKLRLGLMAVRSASRADADRERTLSEIAERAPEVSERYLATMSLGLAAEKRGDLSVAVQRYRQAVATAPNWASARSGLAAALTMSGQTEDARRVLDVGSAASDDAWYRYPCEILTPRVSAELRRRAGAREERH
jgi:tetratricopeptide (TPR) repeat protein